MEVNVYYKLSFFSITFLFTPFSKVYIWVNKISWVVWKITWFWEIFSVRKITSEKIYPERIILIFPKLHTHTQENREKNFRSKKQRKIRQHSPNTKQYNIPWRNGALDSNWIALVCPRKCSPSPLLGYNSTQIFICGLSCSKDVWSILLLSTGLFENSSTKLDQYHFSKIPFRMLDF